MDTEFRFDSDIDNLIGVSNIKNILTFEFAIDYKKKSTLVGVIQMLNKVDGENINQFDLVT